MLNIYADYAATTPLSERVFDTLCRTSREVFGNPSSAHSFGRDAAAVVSCAREQTAALLGCDPDEIIFTSGGTEADNLALLGFLKGKRKPGRVLISSLEHPAVSACVEEIRHLGHQTDEIPASRDGLVDLAHLERMLDDQVLLIAVMQVNNETGVMQPVPEIARLRDRRAPQAALHVDGVQGFLRVETAFNAWGLQSYALSGHKIHALKGTGALVTAKNHPIRPLIWGGGQEGQLRSGTENSCGIESLGEAIREYDAAANGRMRELKLRLWERIHADIPDALRNGSAEESCLAPHILNIALPPVRSQTLLFALEGDGVYVSAGSACASRKQKISPVLRAMGIPTERADCSLRFSLSPMTTE